MISLLVFTVPEDLAQARRKSSILGLLSFRQGEGSGGLRDIYSDIPRWHHFASSLDLDCLKDYLINFTASRNVYIIL